MAEIKSELGTKTFQSRNGMKQMEVSDETEVDEAFAAFNERMASRNMPQLDEDMYMAMQQRSAQKKQFESTNWEEPEHPQHPQQTQQSFREAEHQYKAHKSQKTGKSRLSDAAKKRIEQLCGFSQNTRKCQIDGQQYVLRTLKDRELKDVLIASAVYDGTLELPFESRKQLLARSIIEVAGSDIDVFLGDSSVEARLEFLEELDERLVHKLYVEYNALVNDVNKKYMLTDENAKEVIADIKK